MFLNTLSYLIFLKRKRTKKIKARGCVDGRPQRECIGKEEASYPTISIYALFASCAIKTIEGKQLVICGIPGGFLQSNWPKGKHTYLRFDGIMVDIDMLCEIDPNLK